MSTSQRTMSDVSRVEVVSDLGATVYRQDPDHRMPPVYMSDEAYGEYVAAAVVMCTDVVVINRERQTFYLATRRHLPMAGLWWIGGRMRAGELEIDSIRRNFRRETGLDLPAERFSLVSGKPTRYHWSEREQEPQTVGSDNMCFNFTVELSDAELVLAERNLEPEEYHAETGLQELGRDELRKLLQGGKLHPVIWDIYQRVFGADAPA